MFEYLRISQFFKPLNQGATTSTPTHENYFPPYQKTSCFLNFQSSFQITKQRMPSINCLWLNNFKILEKLEYLKWHASCATSMLSTSNITTNYKILKARREAKSKASLPTIVFMLLEQVVIVGLTTMLTLISFKTQGMSLTKQSCR